MPAPLPGKGRLAACLLYEGLVVFAILLIGYLLPQIALSARDLAFSGRFQWVHIFLLLLAYFGWCWLHGGQTLPMKTWKLKLVDASGHPPRPLQAVLRYMAAWLSLACLGLGFFWGFVDKDRRFLHDRIAGTRIIPVQDAQ